MAAAKQKGVGNQCIFSKSGHVIAHECDDDATANLTSKWKESFT